MIIIFFYFYFLGFIFEWVDEWWKFINPGHHDPTTDSQGYGAFPGNYGKFVFS